MSLIQEMQNKFVRQTGDLSADPTTIGTGWNDWQLHGLDSFNMEVDTNLDPRYGAAVAKRDEIYYELVNLRKAWHDFLVLDHESAVPSAKHDADIVAIYDRALVVGPQLQPAIQAVHDAILAAIPVWYAKHKAAIPDAAKKAQELAIISQKAQQEAFFAEATYKGHVNGVDWCRNNAPRHGVKLPEGPVTVVNIPAHPGDVPVIDLSTVTG